MNSIYEKRHMSYPSKETVMGCINRSKVYTPSSFPGYKTISKSHHGQGSGKMSSAHGCTSGNPAKGMSNAGGRLYAGQSRFKSGNFKQGPCPIGSGSKASSNSYKPKKGY